MILFVFPEFVLGAQLIESNIGTVSTSRDLSGPYSVRHGAVGFPEMGAVVEATSAEMRRKVDKIII